LLFLVGSGRQGSYSTGWDKNSSHHTYNERSLVLRLFKGEPPAALPSAFLESAGVELHLERFRDRERGRVSARSLEYDIGQNDRSHEASTPKQILFRDPSSLAFRRTPLDLEERLFVRCAQTTLDTEMTTSHSSKKRSVFLPGNRMNVETLSRMAMLGARPYLLVNMART